ncbi:MAG: hypothetical protein HY901_03340, partial [Deltaproteobacteria bacterium]|nr:hypothetical protein [Deltaproteobacteria bacterium]
DGTEFVGVAEDGSTLRGTDFIGLELTNEPEAAEAVLFHIQEVHASSDPEILLYDVYYSFDDETWSPLCGVDGLGNDVLSIPVLGSWNVAADKVEDPQHITFACQGYAIAHCVEWGYKPWKLATRCDGGGTCWETSMAIVHQACTRMVRADYCGDGRSFTRDGTLINIYDFAGIEVDTEAWDVEAEWDAGGARCLDQRRITGTSNVPRCERDLALDDCGDPLHFDEGTLLMTEAAPKRE